MSIDSPVAVVENRPVCHPEGTGFYSRHTINVFVLEINPSKFTGVPEYTAIYVLVKSVVSKVLNKRTMAPLI